MSPSKNIIPKTVNPDLQKERDTASFDVEEFARWWVGGADKLRIKRLAEKALFADWDTSYGRFHEYASHEDTYNFTIKNVTIVVNKLKELQKKLNPGGDDIYPGMIYGVQSQGLFPTNSALGTHITMFVDVIMNQGTPEQIEKFGKPALNFAIFGTYAQTELAHGTNVRGIQTRADFDRNTDEFVLNTPTLEAYKWWPAGLGHTTNHAVIVAQLYINNENKGIQMFIVPVRDQETHMPLPGVDIGEIGPKVGMNGTNQGFLGLKNVRIPRTNMLMKNTKVFADGSFVQSPASQLSYMTMVYVRCLIVNLVAVQMLEAATIATRYSAVRRQSPINPNDREPQIIDHVTQRLKLFPEITVGIAYQLASESIWTLYNQTVKEIKQGIYDRMPEMHILSCSLKALATTDSCAAIERLRLACGGHGYLSSANFGNLYGNTVAAFTYEGENTVLLLQVGRSLVKTWRKFIQKSKISPGFSYFNDYKNAPRWDGSWSCIVKVLQYAATQKTRLAYEHIAECLAKGQTEGEAANNSGILLTQAAELHGRQFVAGSFVEHVTGPKSTTRSKSLNKVLENCLELYLVHLLLTRMNDILRFVPLTEDNLKSLQRRLEDALDKIRPDAVAICDGFDFHEAVLNSTLGAYDGNVYERLFDAAKQSPLNQKPVHDSFEKYLKPWMKSNL